MLFNYRFTSKFGVEKYVWTYMNQIYQVIDFYLSPVKSKFNLEIADFLD
jgi:hypothetical protein